MSETIELRWHVRRGLAGRPFHIFADHLALARIHLADPFGYGACELQHFVNGCDGRSATIRLFWKVPPLFRTSPKTLRAYLREHLVDGCPFADRLDIVEGVETGRTLAA